MEHLEPWGESGRLGEDRARQLAGEDRVDLDGGDVADRWEQGQGEGAEPGPDLHHAVVLIDSRDAHDAADGVPVDHEVLAPVLGGPDAESLGDLAHLPRAEQRDGGVLGHAPTLASTGIRPENANPAETGETFPCLGGVFAGDPTSEVGQAACAQPQGPRPALA